MRGGGVGGARGGGGGAGPPREGERRAAGEGADGHAGATEAEQLLGDGRVLPEDALVHAPCEAHQRVALQRAREDMPPRPGAEQPADCIPPGVRPVAIRHVLPPLDPRLAARLDQPLLLHPQPPPRLSLAKVAPLPGHQKRPQHIQRAHRPAHPLALRGLCDRAHPRGAGVAGPADQPHQHRLGLVVVVVRGEEVRDVHLEALLGEEVVAVEAGGELDGAGGRGGQRGQGRVRGRQGEDVRGELVVLAEVRPDLLGFGGGAGAQAVVDDKGVDVLVAELAA